MKRGAKVCVLGFVGVFAAGLVAFLLMNVALVVTVTQPTTTARHLPRRAMDSRALSTMHFLRRWIVRSHSSHTTTTTTAIGLGGPREQRDVFDAIEQAVMEAATTHHHATEHPSASIASSNVRSSGDECGVDRSFAPQCVGVSPKSWQLHRSVQAVGRMTIDNKDCSGMLLGNTTSAYFLTSARCLPWEGMAEHASIEFTNCIGSQVFSHSVVHHLNRQLDFVVLKLSTRGFNVAGHYGFLHLRASGPSKDEVVFVSHYTDSFTKRITIVNDEGLLLVRESSSKASSDVCTTSADESTSHVLYTAARLDEASVGAPVMSLTDYSVVALQLCGGCKTNDINTALSTKAIVDDLNATGHLISAFLAKA